MKNNEWVIRPACGWSSMVWTYNVFFRAVADSLNLSIRIYVESNEIFALLALITFASVIETKFIIYLVCAS